MYNNNTTSLIDLQGGICMKQNKRALSILLSLCIFISALLTGCMSDQEKQKASENIALAKPIIKSFIDTYYNGAEINDVKCATYTGGSVFPTTIASDFVRAEVKYNNKITRGLSL